MVSGLITHKKPLAAMWREAQQTIAQPRGSGMVFKKLRINN